MNNNDDKMSRLDADFWDARYRNAETGWDTGKVTEPMKAYIDQLHDRDIKILVPGCGNAYEVGYLLEKGFRNITAIDISPLLTDRLREKFREEEGKRLTIITGDFFELVGSYDLILEQTFFCALPLYRRKDYVRTMYRLLKPGGKIAGVLFNREFVGGPPFGGSKAEYEELFSAEFKKKSMEPCYNSIDPRKDAELFILIEKEK